jgi:hypothetical protein
MPERSRISEDGKDPLALELKRHERAESARDAAEARWPKRNAKEEGKR